VSERQAAETALRASEQRFRNIIDNVPIGVVYTDLAGPRHPGQSALLRADRLRRARAGGAEPRGA
jgi:PAS domain-containing protein